LPAICKFILVDPLLPVSAILAFSHLAVVADRISRVNDPTLLSNRESNWIVEYSLFGMVPVCTVFEFGSRNFKLTGNIEVLHDPDIKEERIAPSKIDPFFHYYALLTAYLQ